MYTMERYLPQFSVQDCLLRLAAVLATMVGNDENDLRAVYDYRTSPQKTVSAAVTAIDDMPFTTTWTEVHYDYMIDLVIPHDGTAEGLRTAEHRLNTMTDRMWRVLVAAGDEAWSVLLPARNNLKPGAPPENPHVRRSLLFVRVKPN
jgi:hypothetical protein